MAHDTTSPVLDQEAVRGRDDDVGLNVDTWNGGGGLNGDWSQDVDVNFRVRFELQETAGGESKNKAYGLKYSLNGGSYTVWTASSPIQPADTTQYANLDATTQVIGDGTFVAGDGVDNALVTGNITLQSESTEIEFAMTIDSAQVSDGDTLDLRVFNSTDSTDLDTYTEVPRITVSEGAGPTRRVFVVS